MNRRHALLLCLSASLVGCSNWNVLSRSQSPDEKEPSERRTQSVGDLTVPFGLHPIRIEAVGLVTGLHHTGSDARPSPQRAALLAEMQTRNVKLPNAVLASPDTALVLVRGWLRPGIQKGDRFDVEVRIPGRSETTSLRNGYMLETRLQEMRVLGGQVRDGHLLALAEGPVLVDPAADPEKDKVLAARGKVLGGARCLKSRSMGLVLKPDHQTVLKSSWVDSAINKRFHLMERGIKIGVAKAKTDEFIELNIHPRYKDNIERYVRVIRALPIRESVVEQAKRVEKLAVRLVDPITAADAALQLEALGHDGVEPLLKAIESTDAEVRFYAAEALAYLDRREAAEPLGGIAREQRAFRVFALNALGAMDDPAAYEQLRELLSAASAETRYGAFRALWAMNKNSPIVLGERLGDQFSYHVLDTQGPPMIHVTRSTRAEIVLFGHQQRLTAPFFLEAGKQILVRSSRTNSDEVVVSRFAAGEADQQRTVSTRIDDVIRAIVELGGTYPDVVQALAKAKGAGALESRFEIQALPEAGRRYDRVADTSDAPEGEPNSPDDRGWFANNLLPRMFPKLGKSE